MDQQAVQTVFSTLASLWAVALVVAAGRWGRRGAWPVLLIGAVVAAAAWVALDWPAVSKGEWRVLDAAGFALSLIPIAGLGLLVGAALRAAGTGRRRLAVVLLFLLAVPTALFIAGGVVVLEHRWPHPFTRREFEIQGVSREALAWAVALSLATAASWWTAWARLLTDRTRAPIGAPALAVLAGWFAVSVLAATWWHRATFTVM